MVFAVELEGNMLKAVYYGLLRISSSIISVCTLPVYTDCIMRCVRAVYYESLKAHVTVSTWRPVISCSGLHCLFDYTRKTYVSGGRNRFYNIYEMKLILQHSAHRPTDHTAAVRPSCALVKFDNFFSPRCKRRVVVVVVIIRRFDR